MCGHQVFVARLQASAAFNKVGGLPVLVGTAGNTLLGGVGLDDVR